MKGAAQADVTGISARERLKDQGSWTCPDLTHSASICLLMQEVTMQDINHPDLFWPALDRLIAGAPSTSRVAHEVSRFLDREDAFKRLIEGSFRDEPDAAEWRKLCQKARAMARRKLAHPAPYAARLYDFTVRAGLNEIEARLLELAVKLAQSRESNGLAELMVDELEWPRDRAIALMGGLDRGAVRVALGPRSRLSRAGLLELDSDFMGGRHRSLTFLRNFTSPVMEAPCSWKMFFARSTPIIVSFICRPLLCVALNTTTLAHRDAVWGGRQPSHLHRRQSARPRYFAARRASFRATASAVIVFQGFAFLRGGMTAWAPRSAIASWHLRVS